MGPILEVKPSRTDNYFEPSFLLFLVGDYKQKRGTLGRTQRKRNSISIYKPFETKVYLRCFDNTNYLEKTLPSLIDIGPSHMPVITKLLVAQMDGSVKLLSKFMGTFFPFCDRENDNE